jgi:hypothetical protein
MLSDGFRNPLIQSIALRRFLESDDISREVKLEVLKSAALEYFKGQSPYDYTLQSNVQFVRENHVYERQPYTKE